MQADASLQRMVEDITLFALGDTNALNARIKGRSRRSMGMMSDLCASSRVAMGTNSLLYSRTGREWIRSSLISCRCPKSSVLCTRLSTLYLFIYYSWNGGRAEAVCAGGKGVRMR